MQLIRVFILLFALVLFNACDEAIESIDPALIENLGDENTDCASPTNVNGAFISSTNVTLTWIPVDGENSWQIQYGVAGFALGTGSQTNATSSTITIPGLQSANSYDFWIRSVCSSEEFGDWSGPFTVIPLNPNCATPSALTVVRNPGNTSATVNWTAGGTETSWEVVYVDAGFPKEQGTSLTATSKPFTVSGLTNDSYDFYVRAKCSATETSSWSPLKNLAAVSTTPSGDYWPMAINNSWTHKKDGVIQAPMKIISSETISGNLLYKYDSFFGPLNSGGTTQASIWTRKTDNVYYYRVSTTGTNQVGAFSIAPYEVILLKSDLNVNETWTQNITQVTTYSGFPPINTNIVFNGKILEKNINLTVNGIAYTNVIKSELRQNFEGGMTINTYWFASGVGPIKVVNDLGSGNTITHELHSKVIN